MLLLQEVLFFITENQNNKKAEFDKKIIQSNLKFYGVKTSLLRKKAQEIANDANLSQLNCQGIYEIEFILNVALAYSNKSLQEKLDFYEKSFLNVDNWAIIDGVSSSLKFNENDYLVLKNYVKKNYHSQSEFLSRSCYTFLNACSWKEKYIEEILKFIYEDAKYYVLMAEAWLLSNLYLKDHKRIIAFLETLDDSKNLKKFTLRKIYDSLQVSNKEKHSLKKYFKKDKC